MPNGYERASKEIVPAARLMIARQLKERYNLTETRIANILGVAQAAVSKYLNGDHSKSVGEIAKRIDASKIERYIDEISKGNRLQLKMCICAICCTMNNFGCEFAATGSTAK